MLSAQEQSLLLMNLIDSRTYQIISFNDKEVTPQHYIQKRIKRCAILSHKWQGTEVNMQRYKAFRKRIQHADSMADAKNREKRTDNFSTVLHKKIDEYFLAANDEDAMSTLSVYTTGFEEDEVKGIAKILKFCRVAQSHGYPYVWVDTCCIDKSEGGRALSKALFSMFDYYAESAHCFAHLNDIGNGSKRFQQAEWFSRGWTLQEMLAANDITFLNHGWTSIGTKQDRLMEMAAGSDIEPHYLEGSNFKDACVAKKMSWLSNRTTRYPEDMAYCMIGILEVHMPIHDGEGGEDAFRRLQEEVLRTLYDESIFAWLGTPSGLSTCGLLAPWPSHFAECGHLEKAMPKKWAKRHTLLKDSNVIRIKAPTWDKHLPDPTELNGRSRVMRSTYDLALNCRDTREPAKRGNVKIRLVKNTNKQWRRQPSDSHKFGSMRTIVKGCLLMHVPYTTPSDDDPPKMKNKNWKLLVSRLTKGGTDGKRRLEI